MKITKEATKRQRSIIEKKLEPWLKLKAVKNPPSGWIKAIRGALGLSSRQLAAQMGVTQPTLYELESREARKKVTLESLEKAASAMNCQLVYAFIPKEDFESLNDILNKRAREVAKQIVFSAEHSMKLEAQGRTQERLQERVQDLANDLVEQVDKRLWEKD